MKKNLVRILALALVLFLALGIIPLGAFAIDPDKVFVIDVVFNKNNPTLDTLYGNTFGASHEYGIGETIKTSKYDSLITIGDNLYDFEGFSSVVHTERAIFKKLDEYITKNKLDFTNPDHMTKISDYHDKLIKDTPLTFTNKDIKIDPYPVLANYKTEAEYNKAVDNWYGKYVGLLAGYTPHQHALSRWYSDGTTHWRQCLVCHDNFMYQNWCQDGDGDQVCNICGGHVPYHDVTIIESEGGTITVNKDLACYRTKITADVEPAAGYRLEKLHFTKVRDDGSRQEVVRNEKGGQFWTLMPTYDMEVSAEFVKN